MNTQWQVLVVSDAEEMRESLAGWLREEGYPVDTASSAREAVRNAGARECAICFVDLAMPGGGTEIMTQIRRLHPEAAVIVLTTCAAFDTALTALKEGAQDYLLKPCCREAVALLMGRIVRAINLQRENALLRRKLAGDYRLHDVIGKSARMQSLFSLAREIASLRSTVLILGESGSGKEMLARAIHHSGSRASAPFVTVPCAGLAEPLLESALFGSVEDPVSGEGESTPGRLELAGSGTIFLDDVGHLSPKLQSDLSRLLQERRYFRGGLTDAVGVDCRLIAASSLNLQQAVADGRFRGDLLYRLNIIEFRLPPLRERREDIPLLARHFVERLSRELGVEPRELSGDALRILLDYHWPGNVRELENAVERAMVAGSGGVLSEEDFHFLGDGGVRKPLAIPAGISLQEMERQVIVATLQRTSGNIKEAASILRIDRSTLYDKIKRYEIPR
jgi:DNA-binding NtrC family response regulator